MRKEKYRDNGATGALLDEYEKAIIELKFVIKDIPQSNLIHKVDHNTNDQDCKSIQTILTHVVSAGYNYVIEIRRWLGEEIEHKNKELLTSASDYMLALDKMFVFNEAFFRDYPDIPLEAYNSSEKLKVKWGQVYDIEQLYEHAIVHILRHRRQIERFKLRLESAR